MGRTDVFSCDWLCMHRHARHEAEVPAGLTLSAVHVPRALMRGAFCGASRCCPTRLIMHDPCWGGPMQNPETSLDGPRHRAS